MFRKILESIMPASKMVKMFTLKMESDLPIVEIADKVEAACAAHNFALLQSYNYHQIVESKGFPIKRKTYIYDICQAKAASMMLTSNPEFSVFMPCTLTLYEENGKTIISTMNMEIMLKAVKNDKALFSEASNLFNSFKTMMKGLAI
ncbi:MAG: DUF302 domain-containing protein [Bacteroidales bacterium]|nr:DUF302 domain-containing protein [Bacteroidales bacterium]